MRNTSRWGSVLVIAAAFAVSCGGTDSSEADTAPGEEAVATTTTSDDAAEVGEPEPVARDLMTIAEQETVGAGTWTSPLLGEPVTFDITQDLVLTRSAPGLMTFVPSDNDAVVITLLNPTGVVVPAPEQGPRFQRVAYPTDLGVWLEESPDIDLLDSGSIDNEGLEAAPVWFEVATSDSAEQVVECSVGTRCLRVFANAIAALVAISEPDVTTHRLYQLTTGATHLLAVVSAPAGSDETVFAPVDVIAESLCVCGPSIDLATVRPEPIELLLNQPELPAGVWQTTMGTTDFTIRNSTPTRASLIFGGPGTPGVLVGLRGEADDGSEIGLAFVGAGTWRLVDPALGDNPAGEPLDGLDTRDIEAWAQQHPNVRVEASGNTTLGGQPATWWDLVGENLTAENSQTCGTDSVERCVTVLVIEPKPGTVASAGETLENGEQLRLYVFDDVDLMVTLKATQPPIDEILDAANEFFDRLDIQAAATDPNEDSDLAFLEAVWTDALATAAAVPSEPELAAWCAAGVAALDAPVSGSSPEEREANIAIRVEVFTELTRLSDEGARDTAEMLLAEMLQNRAVSETVDWEWDDLSPELFAGTMPDSVDAGGRDPRTAQTDLIEYWAANC